MIYPADFENKIGFAAIRRLLHDKCLSPLGQQRVVQMSFSSDYDKVNRLLRQTEEMVQIITSNADLPTDHIYDVTGSLKSIITYGNWINASELHRLGMSLRTIGNIHVFFLRTNEEGHVIHPYLSALFALMRPFPEIIAVIDKVINKFGEVSDTASPQLAELRGKIRVANNSLSSIMQKVVSRGVTEGYLEKDTVPSMRDGRLVIPVNSAVKRRIPGIVHDESATGKTSYIEPTEIVEASNRLRELYEAEKREIVRILVETADTIRPHIDAMLHSFSMLGVYDFIRAKALIAHEFGAQMPTLEHYNEIDWYGAIHPILALSLKSQNKNVVPLSIKLNKTDRILIISGPNAGGKSVCLKTVAIVQYMIQCGMLPTLYSNSHACIFKNIFIDIGDEQSIENDLSTYSSHLKNMKFFLQNASSRTLILVDEMGSGTEPQIGGALAQAILYKLNKNNVMGIVTTHYQNLKTFADSEQGFVNGAMMYDRQHMQPLFKLAIGNPGSSFALEIAGKIGMPVDVLENAREIVGSDYVNMDKYLLDLARDRKYWSNKRQSIKEKEQKLNSLIERIQAQGEEIKNKKKEIIEQAKHQASELLSGANAKLENTIREIRTAQAEKERTKKIRRELEEYKRTLNTQAEKKSEGEISIFPSLPKHIINTPLSTPVKQKQDIIAIGDYVRMSKGGMVGRVLAINGKTSEVAFGAMRTKVDTFKLIKANKPVQSLSTQTPSIAISTSDDNRKRQLNFKQEIDVRGMRADEAIQAVTYFIDDALQFNIPKVRILHGTGTGILRTVIRRYLQSHKEVVSFHDEDVRFGGAGITVVNIR